MTLLNFSQYWYVGIIIVVLAWLAGLYIKSKKNEQEMLLFKNNQNKRLFKYFFEIKIGFIITGLALILLAVWGPSWGQDLQKTQTKGLDVVFAVDVSKSMQALDFSTKREYVSRLDATKSLIEEFVKKRNNDRIGLVEFAGESFVASPLTLDHSVFLNFLQRISSDDLGKQGTNLAEAIEISIARLEVSSIDDNDKQNGKVIILFSDGDETITSDAKKMAELAKKKGIKIFTVGIGSTKGSPIPVGQDVFGKIIYKKYKGETVITALNPKPLKEIAQITGGEYFHAQSQSDLKKLSQNLNNLPTKIIEEENLTPQAQKYFPFALMGMILFALGIILPLIGDKFNVKK